MSGIDKDPNQQYRVDYKTTGLNIQRTYIDFILRCFIGECNLVKIATFRAYKISKEEDSFPNPEEQKKYTGFGLKSLILTPNFPKYFLKTLFLDISY